MIVFYPLIYHRYYLSSQTLYHVIGNTNRLVSLLEQTKVESRVLCPPITSVLFFSVDFSLQPRSSAEVPAEALVCSCRCGAGLDWQLAPKQPRLLKKK